MACDVGAQLAGARRDLKRIEAADAHAKLAKDKLIPALTAQEKQREYVAQEQDAKAQAAYVSSLESSLRSQGNRIAQLTSSYRSELQSERVQVSAEIVRLEQEATKQGFREGLLELKAPQDGIVKDLATTTLGAVVQPGVVLLTIVPEHEPLVAEVFIRNQDIGFVREGQAVRVKLAAYPFTKYGMLEGTVARISADATESQDVPTRPADEVIGDPARADSPFKASIRLTHQDLNARGMNLPVAAGMRVTAEIKQGERTVMEYLLSPVQRVASTAGGER